MTAKTKTPGSGVKSQENNAPLGAAVRRTNAPYRLSVLYASGWRWKSGGGLVADKGDGSGDVGCGRWQPLRRGDGGGDGGGRRGGDGDVVSDGGGGEGGCGGVAARVTA
ncbi:hypothetical protein Tco_1155943 [Tanacetum coccineum]